MTTVIGVRFREVGKIYYFDPMDLDIKAGDHVIVDTIRGTEYGTVIIGRKEVGDDEIIQPLKAVHRIATPDDDERVRINREKEKDAFTICKQKIRERGLEMKLIAAEYTFDNAKILFYFTADGRVDFRDLVKDLAAIFRIRIELRQVGVRDETKIMGGLGGCGRPLCCASYLSDFVPVSIKMAKEQNLSLNPQKISGVCGRLMCCLKNEAETYEHLNATMPKQNARVTAPDGREGIASELNVLKQRVKVLFTDETGDRTMEEFAAKELKFTPRKRKQAVPEENDVELELIREEAEETDSEIAALAEAELNDIETEDALSEEAEAENEAGAAKKRRRRRRRNRNRQNEADGQMPAEETDGDGPKDGPEAQPAENDRKNPDGRHRHNRPEGEQRNRADNRPQGDGEVREDGKSRENGRRRADAKPQEDGRSAEGENRGQERRRRPRRRHEGDAPAAEMTGEKIPSAAAAEGISGGEDSGDASGGEARRRRRHHRNRRRSPENGADTGSRKDTDGTD